MLKLEYKKTMLKIIKKHILVILFIIGLFLIVAPWPSPEPDYSTFEPDYIICTKEMSEGKLKSPPLGPGNLLNRGCTVGEMVEDYTLPRPNVDTLDYTKVFSRIAGFAIWLLIGLVYLLRLLLWVSHKIFKKES